ncbi:MAG: hypothetical protein O7F75_09035 [Alphaproteobacteria bacterium]|nr:hypothetical protein [Alphaproteobacteria bacterium]
MTTFTEFFSDDTGAVTIDWVALACTALILAFGALYWALTEIPNFGLGG